MTPCYPQHPEPESRDALTGLPLAPEALERIAQWHAAAGQAGLAGERAPVQAILLRLKNFSSVNLAFGKPEGDLALVEVAARMLHFAAEELGANWLVARSAGDTFLLAMNGQVSRERWEWLAEELCRRVARPIAGFGGEVLDTPIRLRPRIALSRSVPGEKPARMLSRLGEALEMQLCQPLQKPAWVDGTLSPAGCGALQLEADLKTAIERGGIEIVYQPQYSCADGHVLGAEALARWQHGTLGALGPETMFAIAERAGLAGQLSRHIVRAALAGASEWRVPLHLSLNVTAADIQHSDFANLLARDVAEAGFAPERLTLEITEKVLVSELDRAARSLRLLTAAGIRIALDDFGAGFCNFRYLKLLPLAGLKLDRSMVIGIAEDARDLAVLRGIVAMAQALGLEVTAEGIETMAQRAVVEQEGCTSWQGFLGSEPISAANFRALVAGSSR